ncbi:MAG: hypothetical protein IPM97_01895 [Bdellovibrionaceae bacterium]|nr:hypothetical protein [Pseudobdellovibrionaceae bacterium]
MKPEKIQLGYEVKIETGRIAKPIAVELWKNPTQNEKWTKTTPFKYMADALVGLSLIKLNDYIKSPLLSPQLNYNFCSEAWRALDPHFELFQRATARVNSLKEFAQKVANNDVHVLENSLDEIITNAQKPWGIDLKELFAINDAISHFENKTGTHLIYHFGFNFSKSLIEKLHAVFSLLFHLRSLIALDYNAHTHDATFEAVKVDAISDYLPKPDYVVHDALLYLNFKRLSVPFSALKNDIRVEKLFVSPLQKAFQQYTHNAYFLVEQLPPHFLNSLSHSELEDALYMVQTDWLLGSEAGALFKIREELFGLEYGYEKIFWLDLQKKPNFKPANLSICCEVDENDISGGAHAA